MFQFASGIFVCNFTYSGLSMDFLVIVRLGASVSDMQSTGMMVEVQHLADEAF
jgi:hypothetical protein